MRRIWRKPRVRKAMHYGVSLFFILGIFGGIRSYFIDAQHLELADGTSYVEKYLKTLFTIERTEEAKQLRKKFLDNNSLENKEIVNKDISVSVVTLLQKKKEKMVSMSASLVRQEYIFVIDFAYRLDTAETQYQQETIKLIVAYDRVLESYIVESVRAFDYDHAVGISDVSKKELMETKKRKTELSGDPLSEADKERYVTQLSLFFQTYSSNREKAKSFVSDSVELAILQGTFDTNELKIAKGVKKGEHMTLIVIIDYSNSDQSLQYEKEYKIKMNDRTIVEMEEL